MNATQEEKDRIKAEQQKQVAIAIKLTMASVNNSLDRYDTIRDPMTRNIVLLDKLCTGFDVLASIAMVLPRENGFDVKFCEDVQTTVKRIQTVVGNLFDWIQHPTYTSNHPVGLQMMQQGQEKLDHGVKALDEEKN